MKLEATLKMIKQVADPRSVKVWKRTGLDTSTYYGASLTSLKELARKIKKNHTLSLELWHCGIHDAKILSLMLAERKKITRDQVDEIANNMYFWDISDKACEYIFAKLSYAEELVDEWLKSDNELKKRSAFIIISRFAKDSKFKGDLSKYLPIIEEGLKDKKNFVRDGANYALIALGLKNKLLNEKSLEIFTRTGVPEVNYGDNSCKVPNAGEKLTNVKFSD